MLAADVVVADWRDFKWMGSTAVYDEQGPLLQNADGDPDWRLAYSYHVGAEWRYSSRYTFRTGLESGVPSDFENVTTTTIGDIRILNFGVGVQHEKWNVEYLLGGMWGDNNGGVEHFCLDLGVQFSRSL